MSMEVFNHLSNCGVQRCPYQFTFSDNCRLPELVVCVYVQHWDPFQTVLIISINL